MKINCNSVVLKFEYISFHYKLYPFNCSKATYNIQEMVSFFFFFLDNLLKLATSICRIYAGVLHVYKKRSPDSSFPTVERIVCIWYLFIR